MSDIAISVEHLRKTYRLGLISHHTLYRDLQSFWARVRGKEDPNEPLNMDRRKALEAAADGAGWIHALKDVSFEVRQGMVLGIIGKNGAGKSTLLKILSRVTAPTSGCVKVRGRIGSLLEVGTGFHPELTGRDNIYMNGAILGMRKREIDSKLEEIIDFSGVSQFIDTPVKRYSSGMYVRLAFAVAAHLEPEILIVDEVLAVGDAEFQKKCLGKMDDVAKREGRTVLFVSHNMAAMRRLCESTVFMKDGAVFQQGKTEAVIANYLDEKKDTSAEYVFKEEAGGPHGGYATKLTIRDGNGAPTSEISVGRPWRIEVDFTIERPLRGFVLGIGFIKDPDVSVRTAWSLPSDVEPGRYTASFTEEHIFFSPGRLRVLVGLSVREQTFQSIQEDIFVHFSEDVPLNDPRILRTDCGLFCNPMDVRIDRRG
jgi:lipopolysaccharide transport system ATP-binding protein